MGQDSRDTATAGRFVIERPLGRGGMATVYLAHDRVLDRPVAVKVLAAHLADDAEFRERFVREARLAAKFTHPHVVQVYDVGEDERGPFIVMELVEGDTLADELARRGRLPPVEVVDIAVQICAALEAAHGARLVHRDIKPQNILLSSDGQVKVADFGVARSLEASQVTELGTVLGTAAYLSPEQARGESVTAAADLYSVGVVLYELLTGQTPFSADTLTELVLRREQGTVTPPRELVPDVPPALEAVVLRCLASSPADRPASAAELARELVASIDEPITQRLPVATGTVATKVLAMPAGEARRRRQVVAGVLLALAALGLGLGIALAETGTTGQPTTAANPPATTAPTTATTAPTTTAPTTSTVRHVTPPPRTPAAALARTRAVIAGATRAGRLDPGAAKDLEHHLDDIAKSLAKKPQDAAHKVGDVLHHLGDLDKSGKLTGAELRRITAALERLAALLPPSQP